DMVEAQQRMRANLGGVRMALMLSTMLHSIATGNMLPAGVRTVCVDINPAVVTKLADRGTWQSIGLVTDVESFLRELALVTETGAHGKGQKQARPRSQEKEEGQAAGRRPRGGCPVPPSLGGDERAAGASTRTQDRGISQPARFSAIGFLGGFLGGLFGVGGGFVMIPLLVLWAGLGQRQANATSLVAILPIAIAAVPIYYFRAGAPQVDLRVALFLVIG